MIGLQSTVEQEEARASLERHRFDGFRFFLKSVSVSLGLLQHSAERSSHRHGQLRHLELLWLPYYLITWHVESKERSRKIATLVGGHERNFSLFDPEASVETLENGEFFEPAVTRDDALDISMTGLWRAVLNHRQNKRLLVGKRPDVEIVQYPFWTYYFSRLGGKLDVKLLDAVTGSLAGPKGKVALLTALASDQGR